MSKQQIEGKFWSTEALVVFGYWLIRKGELGYGLLCIHGPILGMKIGTMLSLKWGDFINEENECDNLLFFEEEEGKADTNTYRELSEFFREVTNDAFAKLPRRETPYDFVYTKSKTDQVLTTSTLNRELNKFYSDYKEETLQLTGIELDYRELKSNAFEIAWARDMVKYYAYSKKAFIAVSKFMGHRTLKHTIDLLGIEPRDEITFRFDLFEPSFVWLKTVTTMFENPHDYSSYLMNRGFTKKAD